jgi:hypothetical protein
MHSHGLNLVSNFMKISQLVQKLKGNTLTHRECQSHESSSFLKERRVG